MSTKGAEFWTIMEGDDKAKNVAELWDKFNIQRRPWIEEKKELRNYVFQTDTSKTSNQTLPWKNTTCLPKLCQIRDNLYSNYKNGLFPNDNWLTWEAYSRDSAAKKKVMSIEAYMSNKTRIGGFKGETGKLIYDYIDYGNAFATCDYISQYIERDGEKVPKYVGPRLRRISPLDIVFDPIAQSFKDSFKIIRSVKTIGELKMMGEDEPDNRYLQEALQRRELAQQRLTTYSIEDTDKAEGFNIDGFGNLYEYFNTGSVEILEFWGDYHDNTTGTLSRGRVMTVIDRAYIIRDEEIPNWLGEAPIYHIGWRDRPDNLWSMGPLDNLVGMQYRIDHLENLKADAQDLAILPPLKIIGDVEEFVYGPGEEIHLDEGGDVQELAKNAQWVIQADNEIALLERRMEEYAGAPSEAMGIRTPGEKTAFEVQSLDNKSSRIFQEKLDKFETMQEDVLNAMLEVARRNLDTQDVIGVMDDDLGVQEFLNVTREDLTAEGKIRPIGARHFAQQAQLIQNLNMLYNSQLGVILQPHTSTKNLAKVVSEALLLDRFELFAPNVGIFEQQETSRLGMQAEEDLMAEQSLDEEGEPIE